MIQPLIAIQHLNRSYLSGGCMGEAIPCTIPSPLSNCLLQSQQMHDAKHQAVENFPRKMFIQNCFSFDDRVINSVLQKEDCCEVTELGMNDRLASGPHLHCKFQSRFSESCYCSRDCGNLSCALSQVSYRGLLDFEAPEMRDPPSIASLQLFFQKESRGFTLG